QKIKQRRDHHYPGDSFGEKCVIRKPHHSIEGRLGRLDGMMADLKYAARMLVKAPAFSTVAILTLALGIGANTAIFSVVEATFWRSLPFPNADRLVRLYEATDDNGARGSTLNISDQTLRQWQEYGHHIFEDLAGATGANMTVGQVEGGTARNIQTARVTANFFSVLG